MQIPGTAISSQFLERCVQVKNGVLFFDKTDSMVKDCYCIRSGDAGCTSAVPSTLPVLASGNLSTSSGGGGSLPSLDSGGVSASTGSENSPGIRECVPHPQLASFQGGNGKRDENIEQPEEVDGSNVHAMTRVGYHWQIFCTYTSTCDERAIVVTSSMKLAGMQVNYACSSQIHIQFRARVEGSTVSRVSIPPST